MLGVTIGVIMLLRPMWLVYQVVFILWVHLPANLEVDPSQYFWVLCMIVVPPIVLQDTVGGVGLVGGAQHIAYHCCPN